MFIPTDLPTDGATAPDFTPAAIPATPPKVNSVPYSVMHSSNKWILPADVLLRYETHYSDKSLATNAYILTPFESSVPNLLCDPSGNTKRKAFYHSDTPNRIITATGHLFYFGQADKKTEKAFVSNIPTL